jgi:hypothetical protein
MMSRPSRVQACHGRDSQILGSLYFLNPSLFRLYPVVISTDRARESGPSSQFVTERRLHIHLLDRISRGCLSLKKRPC